MIYYKEIKKQNSSEWIVMLHGICANSAMWTNQIFPLKKRYNLLLIDLPAHGNSDNNLDEKNITSLGQIAGMIIDIMDSLNIQKAHFAGISIGTMVIGKIYQLYPERINSIVMSGAVMGFGLAKEILINIFGQTAKLCNARTMVKLWMDFILDKNEKTIRELFIEQSKLISKPDTRRWIQMVVKEHKLLTQLDYSKVNILFIMGEKDWLFLSPVKKMKDKFQNIKLSIIKDAGHICNAQEPENFNKLMLDFLILSF